MPTTSNPNARHNIAWTKQGRYYYASLDHRTNRPCPFVVCTEPSRLSQKAAASAIRAGLFKKVESRLLDVLLNIHAKKKGAIALVGELDEPIGVAVVAGGHCQVYIAPAYRRSGLGSDLIALLRYRNVRVSRAWGPDAKSEKFWDANGVKVV